VLQARSLLLIIRLEDRLPPNIGWIHSKGNLAVITHSAITPPKVNPFG